MTNNNNMHNIHELVAELRHMRMVEQKYTQRCFNDACKNGDLEYVKLRIKHDADVINIHEAFEIACYNLQFDIVTYLLSSNRPLSVHLVFMSACYSGNLAVVKMLITCLQQLDRDANINGMMRYAAIMGREHIIEYLIDLGANDFNDAFYHAAFYGQLGTLRRFIALSNDDAKNDDDKSKFALITQDTIIKTIIQVSASQHVQTMAYLLSLLQCVMPVETYAACIDMCNKNEHKGKNQYMQHILAEYGKFAQYVAVN
jgi:ankyrin repeat protein